MQQLHKVICKQVQWR